MTRYFSKAFILAMLAVLILPVSSFGQGRGRGRGKPTEVFVNGHDARDGRWDKDNGHKHKNKKHKRDDDDDDDWRDNDDYDRDRRNRDWDRNGRNDNWDRYGSAQLRQTALNAGYNNGLEEGRKDRSRGERFDFRDESDYQDATIDYNSRLGDRELYRRYFREGFANGYRAGYNGY